VKRSRQVALATAVLATTLTGCASLTSPAVITRPYEAADGTNAQIEDSQVKLRNVLVVAEKLGAPGVVVGALFNDGDTPVRVALTATPGPTSQPRQTQVRVPAHGSVQIGPAGTEMTLEQTPVPPGARMDLTAFSPEAGSQTFSVPVLPPTDEIYAAYTPAPAPTTATPTPAASATSGTPSGAASATPRATPSDVATDRSGGASEPVTQ
jgi:hypothetical protein